ncbi:Origin recognition complex subunit 3 [Massospora cicadina]|nr:Origin recognition complex subunit 3 [Massospora cicadina]
MSTRPSRRAKENALTKLSELTPSPKRRVATAPDLDTSPVLKRPTPLRASSIRADANATPIRRRRGRPRRDADQLPSGEVGQSAEPVIRFPNFISEACKSGPKARVTKPTVAKVKPVAVVATVDVEPSLDAVGLDSVDPPAFISNLRKGGGASNQPSTSPPPRRSHPATRQPKTTRSAVYKRNPTRIVGRPKPTSARRDSDLEHFEVDSEAEALGSEVEGGPEPFESAKGPLGGLTEGCFILPPTGMGMDPDMPFRPLLSGREDASLAEIRYRNYRTLLGEVERVSQRQLFETQKRAFDGILNQLYLRFTLHAERGAEPKRNNASLHPLDLLVVRHGSNRADANPLYDSLIQQLNEGDGFDVRVSDVQRTSLNPGIDAITRGLFADWLSPRHAKTRFAYDCGTCKAVPCDLKLLKDWYLQHRADPHQRRQEIFVVLLRDFQLMDPPTLQALVRILSLYRPALPIWAILGASASPIALESLLPQDTLAGVTIRSFDLVDPHRSFVDLLENLFIATNSVKLGVSVFQLVFDTFEEFTHSITTFLNSLKYALMDHFYSNPLSVLYCEASVPSATHLGSLALRHEHCELIRSLPSFRSHINKLLNEGLTLAVRAALEDDAHLLTKVVPPMLSRIQAYHRAYPAAFQCLLALQRWVADHPCRGLPPLRPQPPIALYNANLSTAVVRLGFFGTLQAALASSLAVHGREEVSRLLDDLTTWIRMAQSPLASGKGIPDPQAWALRLDTLRVAFGNSLDARAPPSFISDLTALLQAFFELITSQGHTFNPQPPTALEFALTRPRLYLPTPGSRLGGAPPTPDAATAYRVYKEAGRLINLYDWLKAFEHLAVKHHHKLTPHAPPPTPVDIQARFAQCLNELKFLGYIQATQRKADHVMKLTWS